MLTKFQHSLIIKTLKKKDMGDTFLTWKTFIFLNSKTSAFLNGKTLEVFLLRLGAGEDAQYIHYYSLLHWKY